MKRITFVNQYYFPESNPPAKRLKAFAEYFAKKGWEVKVITGQPNYPLGKLFKGYNPFFKYEEINGVKVYRFFEIPASRDHLVKFLLNYFSFAFSVLFSFPFILDSDFVFISSPPIFSAIPVFFLSKLFRKDVIFDVRDLYPESMSGSGYLNNKSFVYQFIRSLVNYIYHHSRVIVIGNYLQKYVKENYSVNSEVITNFSDTKRISASHKQRNKIRLVFTGIITEIQCLLDFVKLFLNKDIQRTFEFHLVGDGSKLNEIKQFVRTHKIESIYFYGYRSKSFCDELIGKCDIGVISLDPDSPLFKFALPSKSFEYFSSGKPIIANASLELKYYIDQYDVGWFFKRFDENSIEQLLSISDSEIRQKSKNAKKLFDSRFERNVVCEKLFRFVEVKK